MVCGTLLSHPPAIHNTMFHRCVLVIVAFFICLATAAPVLLGTDSNINDMSTTLSSLSSSGSLPTTLGVKDIEIDNDGSSMYVVFFDV